MLEEQLLEAINGTKKSKITKLLKEGVNINWQNEDGKTPLILALELVEKGRIEDWYSEGHNGDQFVQYKLKNGLFTYHVNKEQRSFPLKDQRYCAKQSWGPEGQTAYYDAIDSALALVKGAPDVNLADKKGNTPLFLACRIGEPRLIKTLLKAGADATVLNTLGELPLHAAAASSRLDGLETLLKHVKDIDINVVDGAGWTALHHLVNADDHLEFFKFLEKKGIDFSLASTTQKENIAANSRALDIAKEKARMAIFPLLDTEKTDFTIAEIRTAALNSQLAVVEKYLKSGGHVEMIDEEYSTSIVLAVARNDNAADDTAKMVELLLKYGADVNAVQEQNFNALMLCINSLYHKGPRILAFDNEYMEHVKIAKILIDNGVNLGQPKNGSYQKALRDATEISPEITRMIVDKLVADYPNYKEELDHRDSEGFTALHVAARTGNVETLKMVVEAGASINIPEDYGFIPLHEAIIAGKYDAAKYLIEQGADIKHTISRGYGAYRSGDDAKTIASKSSNKKILDLF